MEAKRISETEQTYPTDYFNDQWKFWIWDNIVRVGCRKETLVEILLKKNFSYDLINEELSYEKYLSEQKELEKKIETQADSDIEELDHLETINEEQEEPEEILAD